VSRTTPSGPTAGIASAAPGLRDALPGLATFVALVGTALANGGFFPGTWTTATVGFLWLIVVALLLDVRVEFTRAEVAWLGLLLAVVVWTALSITWSISERESVFEVRRDLVYLSCTAALLLLGTRRSPAHLLSATWAAGSVLIVYALARYLFAPKLASDEFEVNLLFRPLGYANAVGIFAGLAAILAVALTAHAANRRLRTLAAASLAPLAAAVSLTASRASALAIVFGLGVMLALDRQRLKLSGVVLVTAPVVVAVVALCERAGVASPSRVSGAEGRAHLLAVWIALGAVLLAFAPGPAAAAGRRLADVEWRRRGPVAAAAAACVILVTAYVARYRIDAFFTTGYRPAYWHVAWVETKAHPWLGGGAGTFADYWTRYGDVNLQGGALDAHNLYLETLAELGPIGVVLLAAALALPLRVALRHRSRPLVAAAAGGYATFLAHAALDWDWEMPTVTLAALACGTAVVLTDRETAPVHKLSAPARSVLLAVALALAVFVLAAELVPSLERPYP
jgi:O-antigen ligase